MTSKKLTTFLFLFYLLLLTWVIVFKMDVPLTVYQAQFASYRSINWIPFAGTAVYNGQLDYQEILLNVAFFIPFGVYLPLVLKRTSLVMTLCLIASVSLLYEGVQYLFAIGVADITDLLANTLGGIVGLFFFYIFYHYLGKKVLFYVNVIGILGSICALLYLYFIDNIGI